MKRRSLISGIFTAGAVIMSSLSAAHADDITFWVHSPIARSADAPIFNAVREFEAATGHKVDVQTIDNIGMGRKLFVTMSSGAGPDVVALDIAWIGGLADAGVLADITDRADAIKEEFLPGPMSSGSFLGRQYALPLYTNNVGMFVNDDMLAAAGIDKVPTNWDEFKAALLAMTDKEKGTFGLAFGSGGVGAFLGTSFIWQNGGEIIDSEGNVRINEPEAVEAFQFLADLHLKHGALPPTIHTGLSWDEVNTPFLTKTAGFLLSGDWAYWALKDSDVNWSVHPLPVGKQAAAVIGGYDLGINVNTSSPDASWELVRWLTGEGNVDLMNAYGRLSPRVEAAAPENLAQLAAHLQPFMEQAAVGRARPVVPAWREISDEIIATAWDKMLRGTSAQDALDEAAATMKARLGQQ